jgi:hypothetical protein
MVSSVHVFAPVELLIQPPHQKLPCVRKVSLQNPPVREHKAPGLTAPGLTAVVKKIASQMCISQPEKKKQKYTP